MADALARVKASMEKLKVFPLPSVVLLPGGALPLHIFEPRYRAMVADALASDRVFAMAQLDGDGLSPVVCAGTIAEHEALPDGRSYLVLTGVCRARIDRELPRTQAYREVLAEVLPDAPFAGPEETGLRAALLELMARVPNDAGQRLAQATAGAAGGALADIVASALIAEPQQRYALLCELDVRARLAAVTDAVLVLMHRMTKNRESLPN